MDKPIVYNASDNGDSVTINFVMDAKLEAEKIMTDIVNKFESKTGLKISNVYISRWDGAENVQIKITILM